MDHHEQRITGVFFEETTINLGTGHTQKSERVKNFCRADQLDNERIKLAYLGLEGLPTGIVIELPIDEFLKRFTLEPNFKIKNENERVVDKHCALAEKHRARKEFNSAEWEYSKALKIDQENLRANFGIGTLYMEMGEPGKAKEVFKKLTQIDAIFEEENKHLFNEFGIELRKANMHDEALSNYMKALEISPNDENLYFNIARLYYDATDYSQALDWINRALKINAHFREAKNFAQLLEQLLLEKDPNPVRRPPADEAPRRR